MRPNKYELLANQLDALQRAKNNGDSIEYVKWIVEDLRQGNLEKAKADYRNQSDKYDAWPEIKKLLKDSGIAEDIDWSKLKD